MTQEEKQILLKDLCGRLPYLVKGLYQWKGNVPFDRELDGRLYDELYLSLYSTEDSSFKPYLHPMSSMTEEERSELSKLTNDKFKFYLYTYTPEIICYGNYNYFDGLNILDWLNSHHFDYHGLIEKGLAIEAPEGMYKNY